MLTLFQQLPTMAGPMYMGEATEKTTAMSHDLYIHYIRTYSKKLFLFQNVYENTPIVSQNIQEDVYRRAGLPSPTMYCVTSYKPKDLCIWAMTTYDPLVQRDSLRMLSKWIPDNTTACSSFHLRPSCWSRVVHNGRTKRNQWSGSHSFYRTD